MSGVLIITRSQIIAIPRISTRDRSFILCLPDRIIDQIKITRPDNISITQVSVLKYNGTVVIFITAIAPITKSHVPIIAHTQAIIPANNTTIDAKSNNDVGFANIATPATNPDSRGSVYILFIIHVATI